MVRVASILTFVALAFAATATPVKRTQAKIQQDITRIDSLITTWDNAVNAFKGTANQANAIHSAAVQLVAAINQATTDTKATAPLATDMDALTVLGQLENSSPQLIGGLTQLSERQAQFNGVRGAKQVVEQDIKSLQSGTVALLSAISAITPAEAVSQATQFSVTLNDAYADTLTNLVNNVSE